MLDSCREGRREDNVSSAGFVQPGVVVDRYIHGLSGRAVDVR